MDNELPIYTEEEVATHSTPEDLWVLVNGKVYDFTQFHHRHPGGPRVIAQNAGKDATKTFQGAH
ncbi:cytochrome b5, partial [Hyaloscypha bicolor E]